MFSFAFYESKNDTLWLARDPMGEKPLYYSIKKNNTYFGSEVSSLASCVDIRPYNIDENSILSYLHLDYIPKDKTILSGIKKVSPNVVHGNTNNNKYNKYVLMILLFKIKTTTRDNIGQFITGNKCNYTVMNNLF